MPSPISAEYYNSTRTQELSYILKGELHSDHWSYPNLMW